MLSAIFMDLPKDYPTDYPERFVGPLGSSMSPLLTAPAGTLASDSSGQAHISVDNHTRILVCPQRAIVFCLPQVMPLQWYAVSVKGLIVTEGAFKLA